VCVCVGGEGGWGAEHLAVHVLQMIVIAKGRW